MPAWHWISAARCTVHSSMNAFGMSAPHTATPWLRSTSTSLVAQAGQHALLFLGPERDALERMVADPAEQLRAVEIVMPEPALLERDGGDGIGVGVDHALRVVPDAVDGAVQGEAGGVGLELGRLGEVAVEVDLQQVLRRDLVVGEAERVDQVAHLLAGHADGDVVEDHHLGPAEVVDGVVAIGELDAERPFLVAPAMARWDSQRRHLVHVRTPRFGCAQSSTRREESASRLKHPASV